MNQIVDLMPPTDKIVKTLLKQLSIVEVKS